MLGFLMPCRDGNLTITLVHSNMAQCISMGITSMRQIRPSMPKSSNLGSQNAAGSNLKSLTVAVDRED
jgi:hypothetical protein